MSGRLCALVCSAALTVTVLGPAAAAAPPSPVPDSSPAPGASPVPDSSPAPLPGPGVPAGPLPELLGSLKQLHRAQARARDEAAEAGRRLRLRQVEADAARRRLAAVRDSQGASGADLASLARAQLEDARDGRLGLYLRLLSGHDPRPVLEHERLLSRLAHARGAVARGLGAEEARARTAAGDAGAALAAGQADADRCAAARKAVDEDLHEVEEELTALVPTGGPAADGGEGAGVPEGEGPEGEGPGGGPSSSSPYGASLSP